MKSSRRSRLLTPTPITSLEWADERSKPYVQNVNVGYHHRLKNPKIY